MNLISAAKQHFDGSADTPILIRRDQLASPEADLSPALKAPQTLPTDPGFSQQWHLYRLNANGDRGLDLRVTEVWTDYSGQGVSVTLHETTNFDPGAMDLVGRVGTTSTASVSEHTTLMATMIAGNADNGVGGVGVAHGATISALIGDDRMDEYDVVNTAVSGGGMFSFPHERLVDYHDAAQLGRGGLGTIQVRAAGNGREAGENTSFNVLTSDHTVIAVGAVTSEGVIGSYSTPGSSILVSGFGGHGNMPGLSLRTSGANGSMQDFGGTSGASAQVAGVVALMLEANPTLGYRDVQEILAYSSRQVDPGNATWQFNGATTSNGGGLHTSQDYGFGLIDAHAAVRLAESWQGQASYADRLVVSASGRGGLAIPDNGVLLATVNVAQAMQVDRVTLFLEVDHVRYTDLKVELISPEGTVSQIFDLPATAASGLGRGDGIDGIYYTFDSVQFWGESGQGDWTLRVTDAVTGESGTLHGWSLELMGDPAGHDVYVYTDEFAALTAIDPSRATLNDGGGIDTINAAAMTGPVQIDLTAGSATLNGIAIQFATGTRIENAVGGDGNDILTGSWDQNLLLGGRGSDTIYGGEGSDTIGGGQGGDSLFGGLGDDTLSYIDSTAGVWVNLSSGAVQGGSAQGDAISSFENVVGSRHADTLTGNAGNNTFEGGGGADIIRGGAGQDYATYHRSTSGVSVNLGSGLGSGGEADGDRLVSIEHLVGSGHGDTLIGTAAYNQIFGGDGNDTIIGGGGPDGIFGGAGTDTVSFAGLNLGVEAQLDKPYLSGGVRVELMIVDVENLVGTEHRDSLRGNQGDNEIEGGNGGDFIDGMLGNDTASYDMSNAGVVISLAAGTAAGGHASGDWLVNVENLRGSAFADTLVGNAGGNVLEGGEGGDRLVGGGGIDIASYQHAGRGVSASLASAAGNTGAAAGDVYQGIEGFLGSDFDDVLSGDGAANTLRGGGGNDTLRGGGGRDLFDGGDGIDTLDLRGLATGQSIDLTSLEARGIEIVLAGDGGDRLIGSSHAETFAGGAGNDTIFWSKGGDSLDGGDGIDTLSLASFSELNETVTIDLARQSVFLRAGGQFLFSEGNVAGFEIVLGSAQDDTLIGGDASETIDGGAGDDFIDVGRGSNSAIGGMGTDTLSYASATGPLVLDLAAGTIRGTHGLDRISGFEFVELSSHADTVNASAGVDSINAGDGDDFIVAGGLNDTFHGRGGFDTVSYQHFTQAVDVRLGVGDAGPDHDVLLGIERVIGTAFSDTLAGGAGDDVLAGGAGDDTLDGGSGSDTADYSLDAQAVVLDLKYGFAGGDILHSIENVIGSSFDDTLSGDGGDNRLDGGDGADILNGRDGDDVASYLRSDQAVHVDLESGTGLGGWAEGDRLFGIENVEGSDFGDTLSGDGSRNTLFGGAGDDTIFAGHVDSVDGGIGDDVIFLQPEASIASINGHKGFDTLVVQGTGRDLQLSQDGIALGDLDRLELGSGNRATLAAADIGDLAVETLFVSGEESSALTLTGPGWVDLGTEFVGNEEWHLYSQSSTVIYVDPGLQLTIA